MSRLSLVGLLMVALTGCDLTTLTSPAATTYLMAPPYDLPPRDHRTKPLRQWEQVGTYESVKACNSDRIRRLVDQAKSFYDKYKPEDAGSHWWEADHSFLQQAEESLCIASNDPRLAR